MIFSGGEGELGLRSPDPQQVRLDQHSACTFDAAHRISVLENSSALFHNAEGASKLGRTIWNARKPNAVIVASPCQGRLQSRSGVCAQHGRRTGGAALGCRGCGARSPASHSSVQKVTCERQWSQERPLRRRAKGTSTGSRASWKRGRRAARPSRVETFSPVESL